MKKLILTGLFVLATSAFANPVAKITFSNFFVGQSVFVELFSTGEVVATHNAYSGPTSNKVKQTIATISLANMEVLNERIAELSFVEEAKLSEKAPICMDAPSTRTEVLVDGEYKIAHIAANCQAATEPSYTSGFIIQTMAGLLNLAKATVSRSLY